MSMKNLILFLVGFTCLSGCGGEPPLFEMQLEAELVIPAGLNTFDSFYFTVKDVPTRLSNNVVTTFEDVDRIQASNATMIGRVQEIDYGIIEQITIDVISQSDPENQKEIFYNNIIPFSQNDDLQLLSSLSNVRDILDEEYVDLEIRIIFRAITPREMDTRLIMLFNAYSVE